MKTWIRLYTSLPTNRKVQSLPPALFKFWVNCLAFAGRSEDGRLPDVDEIAWELHEKEPRIDGWILDLIKRDLLDVLEDGYRPHNWAVRQFEESPSAARMRKLRDKQRAVTVTESDADVTRNSRARSDLFCSDLDSSVLEASEKKKEETENSQGAQARTAKCTTKQELGADCSAECNTSAQARNELRVHDAADAPATQDFASRQPGAAKIPGKTPVFTPPVTPLVKDSLTTPKPSNSSNGSGSGKFGGGGTYGTPIGNRWPEWWDAWKAVKGDDHEEAACRMYLSVLHDNHHKPIMDCTRSYLESDRGAGSAGERPDNFLQRMAKTDPPFKTRWPPAKQAARQETPADILTRMAAR